MKHVVIVGGGFAGVRLARKLKNKKGINVTLINNSPDFRYYPALYRAATGTKIGMARLALEWMLLDASNVDLTIGTVTRFDPQSKTVHLEDGTKITYDIIAFALGSVTTFFNIEGLHDHAYGIKSAEEVFALRKHLHDNIASKLDAEANYVVVGGGPTGVEMAGSLGNYLQRISKKHRRKNHKVSIYLVEGAPRLLPLMPPAASRAVSKQLAKNGVKILTDTFVKSETLQSLKTSAGAIKTHTVIWTAGAVTNPFYSQNSKHFTFAKNGKVIVNKHLQVQPNVYVIGDNAATKYSGLALTAVWHANFVAKDIIRHMHNKKRPSTYEWLPPHVVPAGNNWAVMDYGKLTLHGRIIAIVRRVADYVGYSDVLGPIRALTIWSNSYRAEDGCEVCHKN